MPPEKMFPKSRSDNVMGFINSSRIRIGASHRGLGYQHSGVAPEAPARMLAAFGYYENRAAKGVTEVDIRAGRRKPVGVTKQARERAPPSLPPRPA